MAAKAHWLLIVKHAGSDLLTCLVLGFLTEGSNVFNGEAGFLFALVAHLGRWLRPKGCQWSNADC
jgi:hypothetical protein